MTFAEGPGWEPAMLGSAQRDGQFRDLADALPLLVWRHDAEGGQEWVNDSFCTFFGVSRADMHDDRWRILTHPDDGQGYVADFAAAVAGRRPFHGEVRVRRGDGEWRWLESWARPLFDADGTFVGHLGSSADVTDRKHAEQTLQQNHEFITELTAVLPGVLYVFDVKRRRTLFVNRPTDEFLGYTPEEILALGDQFVPTVLHPDDKAAFEDHLRDMADVADGDSMTHDYRFRHRNGSWRWFTSRHVVLRRDAAGGVGEILGLATDTTERRATEALLRAGAALDSYRARLADALRPLGDPAEVQAMAARLLGEQLAAARVLYAEVDEHGTYATVHAGYHHGVASVTGRHRLDDYGPEMMRDFRAGRAVTVDDVATDPRLGEAERRATQDLGVGAHILLPLVKDGRPVAALVVHDVRARHWSGDHLALVAETAERTWAAVEQARVQRALRIQHSRAELVADVLSGLEKATTLAAQVQILTGLLVPGFADYATVEAPAAPDFLLALSHARPAGEQTLRSLRDTHRIGKLEANSMHRAAAGEVQLLSVVTPAMRAEYALQPLTAHLLDDLGTRSHIAVPVPLGGTLRGALMVGLSDDSDRPHYTSDDLAFIHDLAQRVGVVLMSAHLRRQEHDIAMRLQRALLPDHVITHPNLGIEARYQAGSELLEVGGDWYDTFAWPDGRIGVIVGDVVGHTLDSAAAMGRLRAATAALVAHVPSSPAAVLDALEVFARGPNGTDFVTVVCVVVDPATGRLTYSSAGHPPVVVLMPGRPPLRLLQAQARPMCVPHHGDEMRQRPEAAVTLEPGSLVVMYSDGLVERRRSTLAAGIDRLEAAAADLFAEPLAVVADRLIAGLTADWATDDDVVVACLRFTPSDSPAPVQVPADAAATGG